MSEPVQLAKAAREQLAAALNALQTADVPDELVDAAEPVAQAMGVLHRIERTNGASLEGRDDALQHVRAALGRVQRVTSPHPAVERAVAAIAIGAGVVVSLRALHPPGPASAPPVYSTPSRAVFAPHFPAPAGQPAPQPFPPAPSPFGSGPGGAAGREPTPQIAADPFAA